MPYIHCNVQHGLSPEKKQQLVVELMQAVKEAIGAPLQYIHVGLSEVAGNEFVESGQVNLPYQSQK